MLELTVFLLMATYAESFVALLEEIATHNSVLASLILLLGLQAKPAKPLAIRLADEYKVQIS